MVPGFLCLLPLMMNPPAFPPEEDVHVDEYGCVGGNVPLKNIPVGFRFRPTDQELVSSYLVNRAFCRPLPVNLMQEFDQGEIHKHPPNKLVTNSTEREMFFFTRMSKTLQRNRGICIGESAGLWRSFQDDTQIPDSEGRRIAFKRSLWYFRGQLPKIVRTRWLMELYWLEGDELRESNQKAEKLVLGRIRYVRAD